MNGLRAVLRYDAARLYDAFVVNTENRPAIARVYGLYVVPVVVN
jgi:hypothetical protein